MKHPLLSQWKALLHSPLSSCHVAEIEALLRKTVTACKTGAGLGTTSLLGRRSSSVLIWSALRHHRVSWRSALQLLPLQLEALQARQHQRTYLEKECQKDCTNILRAVLSSWFQTTDGTLSTIHESLMKCSDLMQFTKMLRAELLQKPELRSVLPVPSHVLLHFYRLALQSPLSRNEAHWPLALTSVDLLSLSDGPSLSAPQKEQLAVNLTRLFAFSGQWETALTHLEASKVVRESFRDAFSTYVRSQQENERVLNLPIDQLASVKSRLIEKALHDIPQWEKAVQLLERATSASAGFREGDTTSLFYAAFLSRRDLPSQGSNAAFFLKAFSQISPHLQTYTVLNQLIQPMSRAEPRFILQVANAMKQLSQRTDSRSFTLRCNSAVRSEDWEYAMALACSSQAYDLAVSLTPYIRRGCLLPPELYTYESAMNTAKKSLSLTSSTVLPPFSESRSDVPTFLAYGLHGSNELIKNLMATVNRDRVFRACAENNRLGVLLRARALDTKTSSRSTSNLLKEETTASMCTPEMVSMNCYMYATDEASKLVARYARPRELNHLVATLPRALHCQIQGKLESSNVNEAELELSSMQSSSDVSASFHLPLDYSNSEPGPASTDAVLQMCEWLIASLKMRERAAIPYPTSLESTLVRRAARFYAEGRTIAAPGAERDRKRSSWTAFVGLLHAAHRLHCRIDATRVLHMYARSDVPSEVAVADPIVCAALLDSLALTHHWERALHLWSQRAQREDSTSPAANPRYLLDAVVHVAYYTPKDVATKHLKRVWDQFQYSPALIARDLISNKDARELHSVLNSLSISMKKQLGAPKRGKSFFLMQERWREWVSMAFCTMNDLPSLEAVLRVCQAPKMNPHELTMHGVQRVLPALRPDSACAALMRYTERGETPQSHWAWRVMTMRNLSKECCEKLNALCSMGVGCQELQECLHQMESGKGSDALRSLVRFVAVVQQCGHDRWMTPVAFVLRQMCEPDVMSSMKKAGSTSFEKMECARSAMELLHSLMSHPKLQHAVKEKKLSAFHSFLAPLHLQTECSLVYTPICLLGFLYHELHRAVQHPIAASVTSRMLTLTTPDSYHNKGLHAVARYFFSSLRDPQDSERHQLLRGTRMDRGVASALLHTPRFFYGYPEVIPLLIGRPSTPSSILQMLESRLAKTEPGPPVDVDGTTTSPQGEPQEAKEAVACISTFNAKQCRAVHGAIRQAGYFSNNSNRRSGSQGHHRRALELQTVTTRRLQECETILKGA